ncbi:AbiH family protein [Alistipes senegalensis]|uniref:Bacteriophage abortive infection AbiH family protein n=1 Tax=Alistipes senegalensis JC50 TaxID=1033732 RepID=A0ABY5V676_9BACT|nr:AbiH family protein [Alistipes senegalensis]UEA87276.1 bacteriophage abortive infection AbiH family protein [Alistipes senegalensis]UWN65132.1 bacteriophage abortive infection AbiH family protein [Alistipes senegalensis JC50]
MNRIILIGNGFDLAHGLKTGYKDFIDSYWGEVAVTTYDKYVDYFRKSVVTIPDSYNDNLISIRIYNGKASIPDRVISSCESHNRYGVLCSSINKLNKSNKRPFSAELKFKNNFFEHISNQCSLVNWVDIENEYYEALKKLLLVEDAQTRSISVKKLNKEFDAVKGLLEKYLTEVSKSVIEAKESITDVFKSKISLDNIAVTKSDLFRESVVESALSHQPVSTHPQTYYPHMLETVKEIERKKIRQSMGTDFVPDKILLLNFNYTNTAEKLYVKGGAYEVINIHGELNNKNNPIIFGYGDELDDDYKTIEKLQDNDFLENIKSINYHKTRNYRRLLDFIHSGLYQVFVMGHSCGNSDRTLLNTLFEHDNCVSVKVFYHQIEAGKDDYSNIIRNISRNFNDKARMRDTVVNWEDCSPLVPITNQEVLT